VLPCGEERAVTPPGGVGVRGDSAWWSGSAWRLRLVELDGSEETKRFVVERGPLPER